MTEARDVVEGLLKELERYLGPAMTHIPSVANAKRWLEESDGLPRGERVNLGKF